MGRTPNHRFSRVKGREVSHLESSLDSIKRRFSRPTAATSIESGRDENSETRGFPVSSAPGPGCSGEKSAHLTSSVGFKRSSNRMSDNNEQLEVADDGDGDGSDSGSHHGNGVGNFSVNAHSHTNGHGSNRRRKRESTESHPNLTLGPFTEATNTTVEKMLEAMEALHTLSDSYKKHGKDIEEIPKIQKKFSHLEEQCKLKDDKIRKQLDTIITLQDIGRDSKETLAQEEQRLIAEKNKLEEGQFELKRQKENAEKRAKAKEAELKIEQNKELEKLKTDLDKEFKGHKEILEKDMEKREENNKEKLVNLEAEKAVLSKELQEQNKKSEEQQEELTKVKDSYEDLTSLKDSLKRDKRDLETKLKIIESEFALDSQTMKFYKDEFARISSAIEQISIRYFTELNNDDTETIRNKLKDLDICFSSIPISSSEESRDLRVAHAQRIISSALTEVIWQPFSSEKTISNPILDSLLSEISTELAKSGHGSGFGKRAACIWTTLTMRALQSLSPGSPSLPTSISRRKSLHLPSRADKVVEKVLSILSPLITPTQEPDIRSDLFALAKKAIHVWTYAQTDELKITIQPTLDRESRGEWRSRMFDPPPPSSNDSNAEWDAIPATLPRIYTLFPRVVALKTSSMGDALASLPGSFPEPEQEFSTTEICIHTGTGLAEWSPLVLRGKDEEEQRQEELVQSKLRREIDELSKKLNAGSVRNGEHSRSGSMAQSGSGPQSLTEQWTKAGSGRVFDVDE